MKTLLKVGNFIVSRNFNLGFYAFSAGFFGENAFAYLYHGHIGWGILLSLITIYDIVNFILWLTKSKISVSVKVTKKESV
jgi:hypothetical protein